METDSSHRVIMGKTVLCCHFFSVVFHPIFLYLQITRICMKARRNSKLGQILPPTAELAALERQKNPHRLIMGKPVLPLILGCFDRILCILADNDDMKSSKFGQI